MPVHRSVSLDNEDEGGDDDDDRKLDRGGREEKVLLHWRNNFIPQ